MDGREQWQLKYSRSDEVILTCSVLLCTVLRVLTQAQCCCHRAAESWFRIQESRMITQTNSGQSCQFLPASVIHEELGILSGKLYIAHIYWPIVYWLHLWVSCQCCTAESEKPPNRNQLPMKQKDMMKALVRQRELGEFEGGKWERGTEKKNAPKHQPVFLCSFRTL